LKSLEICDFRENNIDNMITHRLISAEMVMKMTADDAISVALHGAVVVELAAARACEGAMKNRSSPSQGSSSAPASASSSREEEEEGKEEEEAAATGKIRKVRRKNRKAPGEL